MIPVRDTIASKGIAFITLSLIMLNAVVFIEEVRIGPEIIQLYSASPLDILMWLTKGKGNLIGIHKAIFISGFMHGGYIHFFGNMLFLYVFGPGVEKAFGRLRYALFYCIAIFVAFYTHAIIYPHSDIPIIGASGAIAAVMGSYLIFYPRARVVTIIPIFFFIEIVKIPSVIFMIGWFILQGANGLLSIGTQTPIAWWAHIGGFIMGVLVGLRYRLFKGKNHSRIYQV
ncbi:MAG: rhomboid family intramembrane serine protease [Deltaproteobacteria bacterium]|nr:rhomboid family intramembrane serine protease [Deltaproteobacteria bacterium]